MKKLFFSVFLLTVLSIFKLSAQVLTWMNYANPQEREIFEELIKDFEESHPGVNIKLISVEQSQFAAKINAAFATNNPPDIFYVGPENIRFYVDKKRLLNLTRYVNNVRGAQFNDLYPNAVNKYRYDGTTLGNGDIWALPKDLGPFALAYNKDILRKAGVKAPSATKPLTFEEFLDICKKTTKDTNGDGRIDQFGTGLNRFYSMIQFIWGNEADYLDETKTKVTVTDPKFIEAVQFWCDLVAKHRVAPNAKEEQEKDPYFRWIEGSMAFFPAAPWDLIAFKTLPFDYDVIPWPVGKEGMKTATWLGSVGYGVSSKSKYPELAAEFALYLSAYKPTMEKMTDLDMQVPTLQSLSSRYTSKSGNPANRAEYIRIIKETGRSWPEQYTYNNSWYFKFFSELQLVIDGKETAESYCKRIAPKMQRLLDRAGKKQKS
ncbi:ABC transporter substrate-binding protein [Treponema zioleckii]|uniref:ABC transporter substrate-binding protein n=1 Tax=Treponema zioleckii TaxID=331680 RepID=UPI00168AFEFE|nr:sugar ABC transporter substrate-binding protein [Treponema zioleckii]